MASHPNLAAHYAQIAQKAAHITAAQAKAQAASQGTVSIPENGAKFAGARFPTATVVPVTAHREDDHAVHGRNVERDSVQRRAVRARIVTRGGERAGAFDDDRRRGLVHPHRVRYRHPGGGRGRLVPANEDGHDHARDRNHDDGGPRGPLRCGAGPEPDGMAR